MPSDVKPFDSERSQTDESLRVERQKADGLLEGAKPVEETADAVLTLARERADDVLTAARARADSQPNVAVVPTAVTRERLAADRAVREEREDADDAMLAYRAEKAALIAVQRDATDRDLSGERTKSDHALATRDEFLAMVSHDLRDMLNAVAGFSSAIAAAVVQEDHVDKVLAHSARIRRASGRMGRLIGDLVDVASLEAGALAVTRELEDPARVVTEAVDAFQAQAAASGVVLTTELEPDTPRIELDAARILQVLTNLLGNSLKFTPAHGKVTVRVGPAGDDVHFSVIDTGAGIPSEMLGTVFERFRQVTRNDRRGMGLGLYISKGIVLGHGGRIWAESELGRGTTVTFALPVPVDAA